MKQNARAMAALPSVVHLPARDRILSLLDRCDGA